MLARTPDASTYWLRMCRAALQRGAAKVRAQREADKQKSFAEVRQDGKAERKPSAIA